MALNTLQFWLEAYKSGIISQKEFEKKFYSGIDWSFQKDSTVVRGMASPSYGKVMTADTPEWNNAAGHITFGEGCKKPMYFFKSEGMSKTWQEVSEERYLKRFPDALKTVEKYTTMTSIATVYARRSGKVRAQQMAVGDMLRVEERNKLIKRLQDISATEYGPLDNEKIEDDIHDLAQAVLSILCGAEQEVLQGQHLMDRFRCLLCGATMKDLARRRAALDPLVDSCPGAQL